VVSRAARALWLLAASCSASVGPSPDRVIREDARAIGLDAGTADDARIADLGSEDMGSEDAAFERDATPPDLGAPDLGASSDTGTDPHDASETPDAAVPDAAPLSRGLSWVRSHPMFISALTVGMGQPDSAATSDYFDGLHANAIHLWANGLPNEIDGWLAARQGARWVSWVQPDGTSVSNGLFLGGESTAAPGRIAYQIGDEPGSPDAFMAIARGVQAIRVADPGALAIINFAQAGDPTMLEQAATVADIYSYDDYGRGKSVYTSLSSIRGAGIQHGLPYWRYQRAYSDAASAPELEESDSRWDAFSGVSYGFTGHTWFVYQNAPNGSLEPGLFTAPGSFTATKTPTFQVVAQINLELANLGRALTQLTSTDVRYVASTVFDQPGSTTAWAKGASGDPFITNIGTGAGSGFLPELLVGFFVDARGEHYVSVQNVRHTNAEFPINNSDPLVAELDFDFTGSSVDSTRVQSLDRTSGLIVDLPLAAAGGSAAKLDVTLAAGDLVLFKYATGAPFALGP
jgi:hypothetical protein